MRHFTTAYSSAPFFEHFEHELMEFFEKFGKPGKSLLEFNLASFKWVEQMIGLKRDGGFVKKDYSKAYYRRAICYLNMKNFQKSWNDFMYMLRDAPGSNEILTEINNTKNKWKIEWSSKQISEKCSKIPNTKKTKKITFPFDLDGGFIHVECKHGLIGRYAQL